MKIIIPREKLLEALQIVQSVVSTRTSLPILSNVLLRAENGHLSCATTDLDTGIRTQVEATVDKNGATTLPARRLLSIIRELPNTEISIDVDSKNVATIRAGAVLFKINGLPEEEYPPFARIEGARQVKLPQKDLRDMLRRTAYAMSSDESRYVLNGVLLSLKDNKLTVVATDGRRLALAEQEIEFPKSCEGDVILPSKAVNELLRILRDDGEVELAIGENQISFSAGPTYLISKLIEGNYPNYRQVIPNETKERLTLEREIFLSAIRRVAILSSEKSNSVKLHLGKNELVVTSNTPEIGEARETIPTQYKGRELTIAFNPEYLSDPLRNLEGDNVFLDLSDELSPGIIRNNTPFLYVIMPMRTA